MIGATLTAYRWELRKLAAQKRTWLGIATAALAPVVFLISIQISKVTPHDGPWDTPLGPNLRHSGLAIDLVTLKLVAVIGPAIVVALVAGDIVAGEDMAGTLKTILTRALARGHVLAGKTLALFSYVIAALVAYGALGLLVGIAAWGFHPLTNLSGDRISALQTLALTFPAIGVFALPVVAIASFGLFLSVLTRHSVAGVAGTLLYALALQGLSALTPIAGARPYLLVNQFNAWHDLFQTPIAGDAIDQSLWVSALWTAPPLLAAWIIFRSRDVAT